MSQQIQITGGAKVRNLEGVLTGSSGVVSSLGINVPDGIPQLDGSGKILVSQLPNSVMEYKGTWDASTNTPTLADGTGNAGDVYVCSVAGTVNFGSGPIVFYVGDQVLYSGTIWQRASGSSGTVTSVSVTESGDALTITGSPITTSGTINIGFAGNSGQYINGAGGLTTFPTDNITGSGSSGQVTYFDGTNTITGESSFVYDASTNRLGVNTSVPNATIGANAGTDSGYSLLLKNDNANYNGIGFGTDSTYGNLISTEKQGTATAQNLTLLNQSGFVSLTESGNLGLGLLTPNTGLDIYNGTSAYLWLHTATSGTSGTDGVRLALFNTNGANLRNFEGSFSITAEGDFSVITLGAENFRVNSSDGSIYQSKVSDAMLKSVSGVLTAAVAGTDYVAPSGLSAYVPYTGATGNVDLGSYSLTAADLVINHASGSGVAASITKGGNGEALTVVKTSGSGNAASITGGVTLLSELNLTTALADAYIASAATWNAKMSGSGVSGRVAYYDGTNSITSEGGFTYDSSTNRFGVNTTVPNATIGANAGTDSGYSLLLKNADTNYNGIGFGTDSTYGNLISTEKLGTATAKNITILNQSGFVSLTEGGNLGLNILTPAVAGAGIDIYSSTSAGLRFHTATSGTTVSDGAGINFSSANNLGITNYEAGAIDIVTNGNSGVYINQLGYVGINGATPSSELTVNGNVAISGLTTGQIVFPTTGGLLIGSSSLFWDNTNGRLAVGTNNTSTGRKLTIYSASADTHLAILGVAPSVRFADNFTATYSALFGMATASNNYVTGAVAGDFVITYNSSNNLIFGNSNTSLEKMRINSSGNLLINTTTDNGANLNVNGVIYGTRARLNNSYDNSSVSLNVGGQTYMDSRTSRLYQTYNLSSMSNYMHIYDPYSSVNANGGFSIGASSSITTLPSTSIIHFDGVNNRVGIGTTAPSATLSVVGAATFSSSVTANQFIIPSSSTYRVNSNTNGLIGYLLRSGTWKGTSENHLALATDGDYGIGFYTNGSASERLFITSGGNVGIGTSTTPSYQNYRYLQVTGQSATQGGVLYLTTSDSSYIGEIAVNNSGLILSGATANANVIMYAGGNERMRITNGGNVLIGKSSADSIGQLQVQGNITTNGYIDWRYGSAEMYIGTGSSLSATWGSGDFVMWNQSGSGATYIVNSTSKVGVVLNNGSTSWSAFSDERLKENIEIIDNALDNILKLRTVKYHLKNVDNNNSKKRYGLIAQDLIGKFDEVLDLNKNNEDNIEYYGVRYTELIPVLVKAVQELSSELTELKALIAAK